MKHQWQNPVGPSPRPAGRGRAVWVILAWLIGWTVLGAWRMKTRDA